jgi:NADPH-dependent curcumin reductase CurA
LKFLALSVQAFSLTARLAPQTAYWGLHDVGKIQPGETVVVSGAAGAVGSIVRCETAFGCG